MPFAIRSPSQIWTGDALRVPSRFGVRLGLEYWTKDQEDVLKLSSDTEKRMPSDTLAHLCACFFFF